MSRSFVIAAVSAALAFGPLAGFGRAAPAVTATSDLRTELEAVNALRAQLRTAEASIAPLTERRRALVAEAERLGISIDAQKKRPEGVRRDSHLQELLAESKKTTDELERVQAGLRASTPALDELRRRMVRAIDQLLAHDGGHDKNDTRLPDAVRFDLERARTAAVAALAAPVTPLQIAGGTRGAFDDGPRELRDKADLLRDSGDKLRREAQRLAARIDSVDRRRRLRERAGAIDEDLFGESASNRHIARAGAPSESGAISQTQPSTGSPTGAAPPSNTSSPSMPSLSGGTTSSTPASQPSSFRSETTVLRNLVDPATLDELNSADAVDDADRQERALKKAQGELESLATELDRRANTLDSRAATLKSQGPTHK